MRLGKDRVIELVEAVILDKLNEVERSARSEIRGRMEEIDALTAALDAYQRTTDWARAKKLVLPFALPGLNEYIAAERSHRQAGANLKRKWQKTVANALRRQLRGPLREPVIMRYTWYERDRRRDKDNISAFGRKIIQDAIVKDLHALKNDGWANIESFSDRFRVDKARPRVEIEIVERGDRDGAPR